MIAKLVDGNLIQCPKQGQDGRGILHTNLPVFYDHHLALAAEDDYFPVQFTDKPEGNYMPSYKMQEVEGIMQIVQNWTPYTPEPDREDSVTARLNMLEECLLEMSEIVYA